jgi:hypothetical protein
LVFASGLQWQWHALKRFVYALCEFYILSYSVDLLVINIINKILNGAVWFNYVLGFKNTLSFVFIFVLHHKAVRKWTDSTCEVVLYIFLPSLINIIIN